MTFQMPTKDPDGVVDYQINWASWLNGDTIATSIWIVPPGITKDSDTNTDTTTTIWLSGGVAGTTVYITNRITTSGGRTEDRSMSIDIAEK